jgi:hypothetical protein
VSGVGGTADIDEHDSLFGQRMCKQRLRIGGASSVIGGW